MRVLWISAVVVLIDQLTKVIVLNTMRLGDQIPLVGDWLKFTFTQNPGMAFGITFGPRALVSIFSVLATILIFVYLYHVRGGYAPYRASLALILGGAVGNIIDRVFYGVLLGYDTFFLGKVVDFIHVDAWRGYVPDFVPFFGGSYMALFPIWNVADMAIVLGVVGILFFQKTFHAELEAAAAAREEPEPGIASPPDTASNDGPAVSDPHLMPDGIAPDATADEDTLATNDVPAQDPEADDRRE